MEPVCVMLSLRIMVFLLLVIITLLDITCHHKNVNFTLVKSLVHFLAISSSFFPFPLSAGKWILKFPQHEKINERVNQWHFVTCKRGVLHFHCFLLCDFPSLLPLSTRLVNEKLRHWTVNKIAIFFLFFLFGWICFLLVTFCSILLVVFTSLYPIELLLVKL